MTERRLGEMEFVHILHQCILQTHSYEKEESRGVGE